MLFPTPNTRVIELRVHGIMGTTPESLVDAVAAVDVAGDGVGRIVRPADRLRRPAPGPMLHASGRAVPRTVEGYQWSRMTSGGWSKAIWALLFPFTLANLAYWMLPPIPAGSRAARALGFTARALSRVAALLLTMLLVDQLAVASVELFADQCLAPHSGCLPIVPESFREVTSLRTIVGLLPVGIAVYILHRVSVVDWKPNARVRQPGIPAHSAPKLPAANVVADPDTPALRALHVVGALAAAVLFALGNPLRPGSGAAFDCWLVAVVLGGICLFGVLVLDNPSGTRPELGGRWVRGALRPISRRLLLTLAVLLFVAVIPAISARTPGPVSSGITVELIGALFMAVCVLFAMALIPAALIARRERPRLPREFRPWAGGWMAAPILALSGLLGGGFGAGIGLTVRHLLGSNLPLPGGYSYITLLWGVAGVITAVCGLALGIAAVVRHKLSNRRLPDEILLLHPDRPEDARRAARASWWAKWERQHVHHVVITLAATLSAGAIVSVLLLLSDIALEGWTKSITGLGVLALGALAVSLLRAVYLASRHPGAARHLGTLADLASFWPREVHPVVPPCYGLKVVPEVAARAAEYLSDPHTRVVLTGHSQGSLLVAVVAGQLLDVLDPHQISRLGLITAGSQLQWAYPRAFPAVVPFSSLEALSAGLGGRWRALCRLTDPLGGAVTTWRQQVCQGELIGVGYRPDEPPGALPPAVPAPHGALVLGGDHWLPDPQHGPITGRRWAPRVLGHGDYLSDPEWDRAVAAAAGLEEIGYTARQPTLFDSSWVAGTS